VISPVAGSKGVVTGAKIPATRRPGVGG
jgi:hypothetical protein